MAEVAKVQTPSSSVGASAASSSTTARMTHSSGTCSPSPPSDNGKVIKFIGYVLDALSVRALLHSEVNWNSFLISWLIRGGMQVEMSKCTKGISDKLMSPDELSVSLIHYGNESTSSPGGSFMPIPMPW
jgi:hypothetical protein